MSVLGDRIFSERNAHFSGSVVAAAVLTGRSNNFCRRDGGSYNVNEVATF
jgi:hypothetical protein